jgi:hypothetical protein
VVVIDAALSRCPGIEAAYQQVEEVLITAENLQKVAQDAMIEAVVKRG